ncbi:MAG: glutamate racemase [Spirochaetota bacterium]
MATALCFDSGIGGMAYLGRLRRLPMNWIYLADNAYFPFGEKDSRELCERVCHVIGQALAMYPVRFVVLLCNTATVLALDELRRRFPEQQFIGTVPAIKPAAAVSRRRKIAMLASRRTSQADYVAKLHHRFAADCTLKAINAAGLIRFIEEDWRPGPNLQAEQAAAEAMAPFVRPVLDSGADQVVLGCTHFLHLKEEFRAQLQAADPELELCDSVSGIFHRLEELSLPRVAVQSGQADLLLLTQEGNQRWKYWAKYFGMELRFLR